MSKNRVFFTLIFICCLVAILIYEFKPSPNQITTEPLTIAVSRTPLSAPFYIAKQLKLFEKNGLNVEIKEVIGGKRSFKAVMDNHANYGTSSGSVLMFGGLNGQPYSNLASFVESDNDIKLLVNSNQITKIGDLKGEKIGIIKGSASEYFLSLLLELNHLKIADVELVSMPPNKMQEALANNSVSAVATWEPYSFEIKKALADKVQILDAKNLYTLSFNLIAQESYALKHFEQNKRLLKALHQAIEFITTNPKKSQAIVMQSLDLKQDFIDWVWKDYIYSLSLTRSFLLTIEDQARWAIESGLTSSKSIPNYRSAINSSALLAVDKWAVSL